MTNPYDELYRQWDWNKEPFGIPLKYYKFVVNTIKTRIRELLPPPQSLLDVGGGIGALYDFLSEEQRAQYVNADVSKSLLSLSKGDRVQCVAESLPFRDEFFEVVVCSEVLEHVNDKEQTLDNIQRVLKKDGTLVLTTPRSARGQAWKKTRWKILFVLMHVFSLPQVVKFMITRRKRAIKVPVGIRDEPTNESWLFNFLEKIGFRVVERDRVFVFWKDYTIFPVFFLKVMEKKYKSSNLCHTLVFKAIKLK